MPVRTACPHCDKVYHFADDLRGKKVRCKNCQGTFVVAARAEAEANEPPAREPPQREARPRHPEPLSVRQRPDDRSAPGEDEDSDRPRR
jgi:predicted Zn finger-like uncharacterized protein